MKRLNALAEVNGDTDYIDVINAMNTLIDRQTAILKARATKSANKRKEEETNGHRRRNHLQDIFFHKHIICNKRGEAVARHPPLIFIIPPILSSRRY